MNEIIGYIREKIADNRWYFVFPSGIVARFWAQATAEYCAIPVANERFIAWDAYKAAIAAARWSSREAVNQALRTLFSAELLHTNASAPFLQSFVNPKFASSYSSFVSHLARILPSLDYIVQTAGTLIESEAYFRDLSLIKTRYTAFLDRHNLYEPSWVRFPFAQSSKQWLLFFPELCEDWEQYCTDLGEVTVIPVDHISPPQRKVPQEIALILAQYRDKFVHFSFSGKEYRWLVLTIRQMLQYIEPYEIAVSVAGSSDSERLVQEFKNYDIPIALHRGTAIPAHPGGRIFGNIARCRAQKWSFKALKTLLLDKSFPWNDEAYGTALLEAGIKYRCLSNWTEKYQAYETDVWEESLYEKSALLFANIPVPAIKEWYRTLKKDINRILNAKRFADLLEAWYIFLNNHCDEQRLNAHTKELFQATQRALYELIDVESEFFSKKSINNAPVFSIFQSYIQEKQYVFAADNTKGVALYDYKVAAGISPLVHFIINVNQYDATVAYSSRTDFLREDHKVLLNIQTRDMSSTFIQAYLFSAAIPIISVSARDFRGSTVYLQNLSHFLTELNAEQLPAYQDPYKEEYTATVSPQSRATRTQIKGWNAYRILKNNALYKDFRIQAIEEPQLRNKIVERLGKQRYFRDKTLEKNSEYIPGYSISPTDLNEYQQCAFKWLLERGLNVSEQQTEIKTISKRELGILYHTVLENLFQKIKESDQRFASTHIVQYTHEYLPAEIDRVLQEAEHREGFFQKSVYAMLKNRIYAYISHYLEQDMDRLDGNIIVGAEYSLKKQYEACDIVLAGTADLVLQYPEGYYSIVDYKTGKIPGKKEICCGNKDIPTNIQMASYIAMIEYQNHNSVEAARFYAIENQKFRFVLEKEAYTRSQYTAEVASVDKAFRHIYDALYQGFYPATPDSAQCLHCAVFAVCRKSY
ncbi:MAG: PD-(D/E)XK nuclease family protein [Treponema sp.]|jgi:CRISPR/Cas system-associated exonuclease Cas4 (RecB family)|nr:PD-(D/E)XK nuclease family protein [Treponema sp.]